jgi:hypothetical protein
VGHGGRAGRRPHWQAMTLAVRAGWAWLAGLLPASRVPVAPEIGTAPPPAAAATTPASTDHPHPTARRARAPPDPETTRRR